MARGSQITADVYLRRLGNVCNARSTTPAALAEMPESGRQDFALDLVADMEKEGHAGSYIGSTLRAINSWLVFSGAPSLKRIKIRGLQTTPSLSEERVPTPEELRRVFLSATPRERCAAALMAHAGLRPQVLGNYSGTDGLRLRDLPDLDVKGTTVSFGKLPARLVVRPELSKSRRAFFSFIGQETADYVKGYLEERLREGEALTGESDVISPAWSHKAFLTSVNIGDAVRKAIRAAGFPWRPYVLRAYFDTQLLLAESKGKITHSYRQFFMGHVGDIEARYTTGKARLPSDLIEDMRDAYRRSLSFLETAKGRGAQEADLKVLFRRQVLLVAGYGESEIAKLDLEAMSDADLNKVLRDALVGAKSSSAAPGRKNGGRQRVIGMADVEKFVVKGWEWVTSLPDGRAVVKLPSGE